MGILGSLGLKVATYWAENSGKVIAMGVITVITLAILGYGYYKIDQGGYQRAKAEFSDKEAQIRKDGDALMKKRQQEHDLALKQNTDMYIGAIKQYAKNNEDLKRDLADAAGKRLYIRAKCSASNRDTMPSNAKVPSGDIQAGDGSDWAGLEEEDSIAIQSTAAQAKLMSQQYRLLLEKMNEAGMFE